MAQWWRESAGSGIEKVLPVSRPIESVPLSGTDRPRGEAGARAVGHEIVHRRADHGHVEPGQLGRILRVRRAGERQQPRVVGLLAVLRPPLERIDHAPSSLNTLMVVNAGSLAPCRRAPDAASSRRYSTVSAEIRSPGSSAGTPPLTQARCL